MKNLIFFLFFFIPVILFSQSLIQEIDLSYDEDRIENGLDLIAEGLVITGSDSEKSELLWRQARFENRQGYLLERDEDKKGALLYYDAGILTAESAIEADKNNHMGYFWKAVNIGTSGRMNGIMDSLASAKPMRDTLIQTLNMEPQFSETYFVLGQLYEQLPQGITFGNKTWAVSLGYLSVDLHEQELATGASRIKRYDLYIHLARHLRARAWSSKKRTKELKSIQDDYTHAQNSFDKAVTYEGTLSSPAIKDKDEALDIIRNVVAELDKISNKSINEIDYYNEAKILLGKWD